VESTVTWLSRFDRWRTFRDIFPKLEDIPEQELDGVLQQSTEKYGKEYEPEILRTMLSSLDHFLCEKGKYQSVLKDRKFATSRRVLNGKTIELRERGYGKKKQKSYAFAAEEVEQLWQKGISVNISAQEVVGSTTS